MSTKGQLLPSLVVLKLSQSGLIKTAGVMEKFGHLAFLDLDDNRVGGSKVYQCERDNLQQVFFKKIL